jgi:hypothetical protein
MYVLFVTVDFLESLLILFVRTQDKPQEDPQAVGDPYKTLFISRLVRLWLSLSLTLS